MELSLLLLFLLLLLLLLTDKQLVWYLLGCGGVLAISTDVRRLMSYLDVSSIFESASTHASEPYNVYVQQDMTEWYYLSSDRYFLLYRLMSLEVSVESTAMDE